MDISTTRFKNTISEFDAVNAQDPNLERSNGKMMPKELIYSQRMSEMLAVFMPQASEVLQLAARCQHIKRWSIPRSSFPMDKKGYLLWRTRLKKFHGELAGEIMRTNGYSEDEIHQVDNLLNKRKLKTEEETQALEDVICLVFLKFYFDDFLVKHPEDKTIDIVRKTWQKMSARGHDAAMAIAHSNKALDIIQKALLGS